MEAAKYLEETRNLASYLIKEGKEPYSSMVQHGMITSTDLEFFLYIANVQMRYNAMQNRRFRDMAAMRDIFKQASSELGESLDDTINKFGTIYNKISKYIDDNPSMRTGMWSPDDELSKN